MKSEKNLVFIGMMGSGKSTIGNLVSKKLKLNFFDTDSEIENQLKMKISEIFKEKGEIYFRNLEEKITMKKLKENNAVISLGGGTFENLKIRKDILHNHLSFWLKWEENTILKRIRNSKKRPLAFEENESNLKNLMKRRKKIYEKALFTIKCDNLSKNEIVDKIINIYENNKDPNQN